MRLTITNNKTVMTVYYNEGYVNVFSHNTLLCGIRPSSDDVRHCEATLGYY